MAFTQKTLLLVKKASLMFKTLKTILHFAKKRSLLFSRMQRFFLQMGLLKTQFGRDLFLKSVFQTPQEHLPFQEAPNNAVQAYDALIEKLFSHRLPKV